MRDATTHPFAKLAAVLRSLSPCPDAPDVEHARATAAGVLIAGGTRVIGA
jgi:hypothetical protein